jgi:predicted DNA-binding protein
VKKTMIYLPDDLHKNLKRLAVERDRSMADLIRDAATALIEEDREDIEEGQRALREFQNAPRSAVPLETYHRGRRR